MAELRVEVQHFIGKCDWFLEFAQKAKLSTEECEALKYYVYELSSHVTRFCQ